MMKLLLASKSERRSALLRQFGVEFEIEPSRIEEIGDGLFSPHIPLINAIAKAEEVAIRFPDALVLGADTVIEYHGTVIGKPRDTSDAERILNMLSGRTHAVISGVCLRCCSHAVRAVFAETTSVTFKTLIRDDVTRYLSLVNVFDKAGAYAAQEYGDMLIAALDGPLDNVVGLPCEKVLAALAAIQGAIKLKAV